MDPLSFIFAILVLIISIIAHEIAHGYVAEHLGDPTARLAGRLTLNPIVHLDMVGSFIVPVATFFLGGFIFGWAKPVPYNPNNMQDPRWGSAIVGAAGPLTNVFLALVFGLLIRFAPLIGLPASFIPLAEIVVILNLVLALFNSIPIPPLDGSKILFAILPYRFYYIQSWLERNWWIIIIFIVLFLWRFLFPVVLFFFSLITGNPLL